MSKEINENIFDMLNDILTEITNMRRRTRGTNTGKYTKEEIGKLKECVDNYVALLPVDYKIKIISAGLKEDDIKWYIIYKIIGTKEVAKEMVLFNSISANTNKLRVFNISYFHKRSILQSMEPYIFPTLDEREFLIASLKPLVRKGDKDAIKMYIDVIKALPKPKSLGVEKTSRGPNKIKQEIIDQDSDIPTEIVEE